MEIGIWFLLASLASVPGNALREHNLEHNVVQTYNTSEQCMRAMDKVSNNMPNNQDWTLRCAYAYPNSEFLWETWNNKYRF